MPPLRLPKSVLLTRFLGAVSVAMFALPSAAITSASGCTGFAFNALHQHAHVGATAEQVSLALQAGLLQPQLEQLLQQQFAIEVVDWQVSPHFRWPADYRMHAPSWHELLERLLKPYQLAVTLYPNKSATVRYQSALGAAL